MRARRKICWIDSRAWKREGVWARARWAIKTNKRTHEVRKISREIERGTRRQVRERR